MSFSNLKRGSDFEDLKKKMEATSQPSGGKEEDDSRFWTPTVDKVGNGMAIVRFLPAPAVDGDDGTPWVGPIFKHGFQAAKGWLIDHCPTTLGAGTPCPVCEYNTGLWNSGVEADKEIARKQKRKLTYIANVLVVSDPSFPENEGHIKLFRFGKKIFDKLEEKMSPKFADETPLNPFDLWRGANFKIKMRQVEGFRNYDKSEFETPTAVSDDDAKLEEIWKKEYSLKEFIKPSLFKSYEQIKARLDLVLGNSGNYNPQTKAEDRFKTPVNQDEPNFSPSDKDELDYFKSLASSNMGDDVPF